MLAFDSDGLCLNNSRIRVIRKRKIEHRRLQAVRGLIVHQTDSSSAASTLSNYENAKANGAHFLITEHGEIIQTASVFYETAHIGRLNARCVFEKRCREPRWDPRATDRQEMAKKIPDRYPSNREALGIEIVGRAYPVAEPDQAKRTFEKVSDAQNISLKWLVAELLKTFDVSNSEVFRHPMVSAKNETEASTARW